MTCVDKHNKKPKNKPIVCYDYDEHGRIIHTKDNDGIEFWLTYNDDGIINGYYSNI